MILAIILLTAVINILLGVITYKKNPKSATHQLLTVLSVIFASWTIANYLSLNSPTEEETLFWIRAVMFITAPMGPILYLFVKAYPHAKLHIHKTVFLLLLLVTIFVEIIAFTPFIFSGVSIKNGIQPTPGPGIILYGILLIGTPIAGFIELFRKYKKSSGIEKLQLKYLVLGIVVTFGLLILTNFISVVAFNFSGFVIFGPLFSLILIGFIFYAIIRHRLLDIRLVLARSVAYSLLIAILVSFYLASIFLTSYFLLQGQISNIQALTYAILVLLVAFSFEPLKRVLENVTDKIFFRSRYNTNQLVSHLTQTIASTFGLEELTRKSLNQLLTTMRITRGAFLIFKSQKTHVVLSDGYSQTPKYEKKIVERLSQIKQIVILDEEKNRRVKHLMRELDVSVILPLYERETKVGLLLLGEKKSGEIYSQQDIEVLGIFGPEISLAIQNAKSYEEISRFNITLRDEIEKATRDLRAANEKLKDLDRLKNDFVGIASHELRTPVTSIKAYTQLLHRKFWEVKDIKSAGLLRKMDSQLDKLSSLINDLLDVTKIEKGKLQFQLGFFELNELVKEIREEMQRTTESHTIVQKLDKSKTIYGDRDRIGQVLTNLISNAIKYSPGKDSIIVTTSVSSTSATISVQDFGVGLSKGDQKKIFERFYRAGDVGKETFPGLGLGLYISNEIIKRHGGRIWVESIEEKGSTFSISLPIQQTGRKKPHIK